MRIVMFTHPAFLGSQSMPRFARALADAFTKRGHQVDFRTAVPRIRKLVGAKPFAKWAGYVDQYLIFPMSVRSALRRDPADTLYVFCDQALGPWVPLVKHRPHVVHCHDLLALRSALGEIPENPTSFTGRIYQRYIKHGFRQARHFIAVSEKSRDDLHRVGTVNPVTSTVVYNGMNFPYARLPAEEALSRLAKAGLAADARGMLLHVGGSQWYKNAQGVIGLYREYASRHADPLPLWMVSPPPDAALSAVLATVPPQGSVTFVRGIDNPTLQAAYSHARAFLFPSLAEGFGWPIAEALACGCPVLTTGDKPMTEVGGPAAHYLPRLQSPAQLQEWSVHAAGRLADILSADETERLWRSAEGIAWTERFDADRAADAYLRIYADVLAHELAAAAPVPSVFRDEAA